MNAKAGIDASALSSGVHAPAPSASAAGRITVAALLQSRATSQRTNAHLLGPFPDFQRPALAQDRAGLIFPTGRRLHVHPEPARRERSIVNHVVARPRQPG